MDDADKEAELARVTALAQVELTPMGARPPPETTVALPVRVNTGEAYEQEA